jgi:hypothetical protein
MGVWKAAEGAPMRRPLFGGNCARDEQTLQLWDQLADSGSANPRLKPTDKVQASWDEAKSLFCSWCPIQMDCLRQGMDEQHGIWGGVDQYQRERWRRNASRQRVKERELAKQAEPAPVRDIPKPAPVAPAARQPVWDRVKPDFPQADPVTCDAWIRDHRGISPAWYEATTPDGVWMRMKIKGHSGRQAIKWIRSDDVSMRRPMTPVIEEYKTRAAAERSASADAA